jgi:hypothetical protein
MAAALDHALTLCQAQQRPHGRPPADENQQEERTTEKMKDTAHNARIVIQQTPAGMELSTDGIAADILEVLPIATAEILKRIYAPHRNIGKAVEDYKQSLDDAVALVCHAGTITIGLEACRAAMEGRRPHE